MPEDGNQIDPKAELAQIEFTVITDVLLVPLAVDNLKALPPRRRWKSGCIQAAPVGLPDLVPVNPRPDEGEQGFCRVVNGQLLVTVKNAGNARAPASTTRVAFDNGPAVDRSTLAIDAGQSVHLMFAMPDVNTELGFTITVNARSEDEVVESDAGNNAARGLCAARLPDLVPSFRCAGEQLIVTVRNEGTGKALASTTRVIFPDGPEDKTTPPIEANGSVDIQYDIAANTFFTIVVNARSEDGVVESDSSNNQLDGNCIE